MSAFDRRTFLTAGLAGPALLSAFDQALLGPAMAQETPKRGGTLVYAQLSANRRSSDARSAKHPYFIVDANTRLQWNCLTWVNEKLEWEYELASKIEPTDAKMNVWDVTVREGVLFHDGRELTARDVVASFEYHRKNAPFAGQIVSIEALDKLRARFTLDTGNSEFPYILAEYNSVIMPAAPIDTIGFDGIGTGPFRIVSTDPNRSLIMERFDRYWRQGFPFLDRVECHNREGQQEAALNGLRAGQFDVVFSIDPRAVRQLGDDPAYDVATAKGGYHFVIQLPKHPGSPFLDKRVRQAFAYAIDREAIVRIAYGGRFGWVGNDSHLVVTDPNFVARPRGRDVAKAKALLAEAGYPNGITLPTLYFSPQLPEVPVYFQVLQQSVKDAGITVAIEERPNDGYIQFRTGNNDLAQGNFHKFAMTAVGSRNPGISLFRMRGGNVESGHWRGPEHDRYMALYSKAMVTAGAPERKAIYAEMQAILHEEVPAILPAGGDNFLVKRKAVRNLKFHPQIWSVRLDETWKA
jgi:peptide/nickel transport system substrate-binding protein